MRACVRCGDPVDLPLAKYCGPCRAIVRTKPAKYPLTPERKAYLLAHYRPSERGISFRCARVLGVPKWRVCRWAAELGLTGPGRLGPYWTAKEDAFLEEHLGTRTLNWISKQLGRSITACQVRAKRLRISRRDARSWYTAHQVAEAFGVDPSTVVRWIERGQKALILAAIGSGVVSVAVVRARTGLSESVVQSWLLRLYQHGVVTREPQSRHGSRGGRVGYLYRRVRTEAA